MPLEVERRFLVAKGDWQEIAYESQSLRQGYLSSSRHGWTIRIRIIDNAQAWITLKISAKGIARHEFEYEIPLKEGESIFSLTSEKVIKTRHKLNLSGGDWVIDCFEGENAPLVIAEVELPSTESIINVPNWCFREITDDSNWSNAALAQNPICKWPSNLREKNQLG